MSCSSSDEENLELLREALDSEFLKDSLFSAKQEKLNTDIDKQLPRTSLRKSAEDEDYNFFKVTPEFRNFVAKHLSALLDQNLERNLEYRASDEIPKKRRKRGGIKLLSDSEKYLKLKSEALSASPGPARSIRAVETKIKVDEESLRKISVSGNDIIAKKGTEHWSNRTKAQVFHYKKSACGELALLE